MSKPVRRPRSKYFYFIKEVPADLREIVGKTKIKISLKTTDPVEAAVRNEELDILWTGNFTALRSGIITLTHRQRVAVAGVLYRQCEEQYRENPEAFLKVPGVGLWAFVADAPDAKVMLNGRKEVTDRIVSKVKSIHRPLLNDFLVGEGLRLSEEDFGLTLQFVNRAMYESAERIARYRDMDYAPDADNRYPAWEKPVLKGPDGKPIVPEKYDLLKIYDKYADQQDHAPKTEAKYRPILEQVAKEHPDVRTITREWCIAWRDKLLGRGLASTTVKNAYLSILGTVCAEAVGKLLIDVNPAANIRVQKRPRTLTRTVPGFSDRETAVVLTATMGEMSDKLPEDQKRARRWLPWLSCYSGARIGELAQLRGVDVVKEAGFWFIELTPAAGRIKTRHPRRVPVHPHLMLQGFVKMAREVGDGPLFAEPSRRRSSKPTLSKKTAENIGRWVRSLGVDDPELQPTHGWRHRFVTLRRGTSIKQDMAHYITGHVPTNEGERYGGWRPEILGSAMQEFPYIDAATGIPRKCPEADAPQYFPAAGEMYGDEYS